MNIYKLQEGLDALDRIKLLMEYDMSKTLTENKLLSEQPDEKLDTRYNKELLRQYNKKSETTTTTTTTPPPTYEEVIKKRGVPWGFEPDEYPEYLKKVQEINQRYDKQDKYKFQQFQQNPTDAPMGNTIQRQKGFDTVTVGQKQRELDDLKKEYYHFDFPYGISKEDYKLFTDWQKLKLKEKQKEFADDKKFYQGDIRPIVPGSDYFATVSSNQRDKIYKNKLADISKKYQTMEDYLNVIFQYDPNALAEVSKSGLQKFWDTWQPLIEIVAWLAADFLSDGFALAAEARQAYVLAKVIRLGIKFGLPFSIGAAITLENKGLTSESVMYFVFAVLPYAHAAFGLTKAPTLKLVDSIITKMAKYNLNNPKELKLLVSSFSQSEKSLFRRVALFDKNTIENGSKWAIKNIPAMSNMELSNINNLIIKYGLKTIKPSMLIQGGKFVGRLAADLTAIHLVTDMVSSLGLTMKDDKKKELVKYFDNLLKSKEDPGYKLMLTVKIATLIKENPDSELNTILNKAVNMANEEMGKNPSEQVKSLLSSPEMADFFDSIIATEQQEQQTK